MHRLTQSTKIVLGCLSLLAFILMFSLKRGSLVFYLNYTYSESSVLFWRAINMLGDGILFACIAPVLLLHKFRRFLYFALVIIIQTLIVQLFKRGLLTSYPRPYKFFQENFNYLLDIGDHVNMHYVDTFPSGHATTAFSIGIFAMFFVKKSYQQLLILFIVCVAAMARVYLAQHFFYDICAGLFCSLITFQFADILYEKLKIYKIRGSLLTVLVKELRKEEAQPAPLSEVVF